MSYAKYSKAGIPKGKEYSFNAYGKKPPEREAGQPYDEKIHFDGFDDEGFDRYGYSSFDHEGNFVGLGQGVDRDGVTEYEYEREYTEELRRQIDDDSFSSF